MALTTKDFTSLVQEMVTNVQGYASALVDLTIGSILRAALESVGAVVMWLQGMILALLAITRAATSGGADLDSWVGDYGMTRLPANFATGNVTFSRFTPTQQAVVPISAITQTADGSEQFQVTLDSSNPAYNASLGGYVITPGVTSVTVPVEALVAGSAANVVAGAISTLAQAVVGVDTASNASAFTNGEDAETDTSLRARFIAYIQSLSKGTKAAIIYAIAALQQGLTYTLTENQSYAGVYQPGYFYAVVDDGTGTPSDTLISTVYNAVDAVRGFTITFDVKKPVVETAAVVMTITVASGYDHATVAANVVTAIESYINTLALGVSLPYTRIPGIAYGVDGVTNVSGVTLNGGTSDLTATAQQVIKCSSCTVN